MNYTDCCCIYLVASAEQHVMLSVLTASNALGHARDDRFISWLRERLAKGLGTHGGSPLILLFTFHSTRKEKGEMSQDDLVD